MTDEDKKRCAIRLRKATNLLADVIGDLYQEEGNIEWNRLANAMKSIAVVRDRYETEEVRGNG